MNVVELEYFTVFVLETFLCANVCEILLFYVKVEIVTDILMYILSWFCKTINKYGVRKGSAEVKLKRN